MSIITRCPDISLEELYSYITAQNRDVRNFACRISFSGDHRRNVCRDISRIEKSEKEDDEGNESIQYLIESSRRGLYDALPEYMFHDIDTFSGIPDRDRTARFHDECDIIENKVRDARNFMAPVDAALFNIGLNAKTSLSKYASSDIILQNIISGDLEEEYKDNEFVRRLIPFLPYSRFIRGNKVLISILLRKLFREDGIKVEYERRLLEQQDRIPRYDVCLGGSLNEMFLGEEYQERADVYRIHYWSDEDSTDGFDGFLVKMEQFRNVVQDYFFSVEDIFEFEICDDRIVQMMPDDDGFYLNYNTNI